MPRSSVPRCAATEGYLERWSDVGEVEQARNRALVTEFVRRLAPELATAVVAQLDMDSLMTQLPIDSIVAKVDIDALLDHVDVEGIIDRVDVEKIIDRVDVEKIIDRVDVEKIIDRVDVEKIIDRVDINGIVGRVDMQGIMGQIDIAPMAQDIIATVDIGAIVRESTGSITGDAVDGGRLTAMRIDGFIDRVADRILFRKQAAQPRGARLRPGDRGGAPWRPRRRTMTAPAKARSAASRPESSRASGPGSRAGSSRTRIDWGIVTAHLLRHPLRAGLFDFSSGSGKFDVPQPPAFVTTGVAG